MAGRTFIPDGRSLGVVAFLQKLEKRHKVFNDHLCVRHLCAIMFEVDILTTIEQIVDHFVKNFHVTNAEKRNSQHFLRLQSSQFHTV